MGIHGLYCDDNPNFRQFLQNSLDHLNQQAQILNDALLDQVGVVAEVIKAGENILGVDGTYTADADATALDIAAGKIAYVNGQKVIGTVGVVAEVIKTGENILGVVGTYTADADATALDIAAGKIAYVNGQKIIGTAGIAEYALTIDATGGTGTGTVTVDGTAYSIPVNYKAGSKVELVATADGGSIFVKWTIDGADVSTDATFTYTMPTQATTVVAVFDLEQ